MCAFSMRDSLTFSQVCIDAHISSSSSQTLVFSVWDVFLGLWVYVLLRQAKVYDVYGVLPFRARSAHQEVLRLHISIDQASGVDKLHTGYLRSGKDKAKNFFSVKRCMFSVYMSYQLYGYHKYSL